MAVTRQVSVKIALEGYSEYRATISKLNDQNKLLQSQLAVIDKIYKNNTGSIEHLTERQKVLQESYDTNVKKLNAIGDALEYTRTKQEEYSKEVEEAQGVIDALSPDMDYYRKQLEEMTEAYNDYLKGGGKDENVIAYYEETIAMLTKQVEEFDEASKSLDKYQAYLNTATKKEQDLIIEFNNQSVATDNAREALEKNSEKLIESSTLYEQLAKKIAVFNEGVSKTEELIRPITNVLKDSVKSSTEFESAMAGVNKTFPGTQSEFKKLTSDIKEMSTRLPSTTTELAHVAEIAGQLGIKSDEIAGFTEVVVGLGNATNITSEEAGTLLAQFKNVNDFVGSQGIVGYQRFASALVELGNNSATTEKDIMAMAQRFSSAGTLAGLSAPEILGMSTALSSVGVASESGGTSLTKLTQRIQKAVETNSDDLEKFAKIAGVSAEDFALAWESSPIDAIQLFIDGLHETYEEGDSVIQLLDEVGFGEVRLRQATMSLSTSQGGLRKYVNMANKAWTDNVALQKEVDKRYETTESKQQMLKNSIELVKVEIGNALLPVINTLLTSVKDILVPIANFIEENPKLVEGISIAVGVILGLNTAVSAFNSLMGIASALSNPVVLSLLAIATAVAAVAEVFDILNGKQKEYIGDVERFGQVAVNTDNVISESTREYARQTKAIEDTRAEADLYLAKLKDLESKGKLTKDEQKEYNEALENLKKLFPDLNIEIDKHTGKIKGGTDAIKEQIDAWEENAKTEIRMKRLTTLYNNLYDAQDELSKNTKQYKKDVKELERTEKELNEAQDEYSTLMFRNIPLTEEQRLRRQELEATIEKLKDRQDELNQSIADEKVAIIADKDAIVESQNAIKNWEGVIQDASKATDDNTTANEKNADSYDQSDKARRNGEKTIKAFVNGQVKYFTTEEWKAYRDSIKSNTDKAMDDAGADAKNKGKEVTSDFAEGMKSNSAVIKNAFKGIVSEMDFKVTLSQTSASSFAAKVKPKFAEGGIVTREMDAIVGEAGAEAIIPLSKLPDIMQKTLALNEETINTFSKNMRNDNYKEVAQVVSLLARYLPKMSNMQVVMDGNKLVGQLAPKFDNYYVDQQMANERGI